MERPRQSTGGDDGAGFRRVDRWGHLGDRLTTRHISLAVKEAVAAIGVGPARYPGHSAQAGFFGERDRCIIRAAAVGSRAPDPIGRRPGGPVVRPIRAPAGGATPR